MNDLIMWLTAFPTSDIFTNVAVYLGNTSSQLRSILWENSGLFGNFFAIKMGIFTGSI